MPTFIQRHAASVIGVLASFVRVRRCGTLRWLSNVQGDIRVAPGEQSAAQGLSRKLRTTFPSRSACDLIADSTDLL